MRSLKPNEGGPRKNGTTKSGLAPILHIHKTNGADDRGVAIMDIFRLENGKIVEHWDITQDVPKPTTSGNAMF